jgi:hypothetical protein
MVKTKLLGVAGITLAFFTIVSPAYSQTQGGDKPKEKALLFDDVVKAERRLAGAGRPHMPDMKEFYAPFHDWQEDYIGRGGAYGLSDEALDVARLAVESLPNEPGVGNSPVDEEFFSKPELPPYRYTTALLGAIDEDIKHGPSRPYDQKTRDRWEDEVEDAVEEHIGQDIYEMSDEMGSVEGYKRNIKMFSDVIKDTTAPSAHVPHAPAARRWH